MAALKWERAQPPSGLRQSGHVTAPCNPGPERHLPTRLFSL